MKAISRIIAALACLLCLALTSLSDEIDVGALIGWGCPLRGAGPAADPWGDRLYLRLVDSTGHDLEVWCIRTSSSHHYEFWVSYPNGDKTKVSECELFRGKNKNTITVSDGNYIGGRIPGGGNTRRYKGRFGRFTHHNFNSSYDFHFAYDYATRKWHRYNTKKYTDANGKKRERYSDYDDGQFSYRKPREDFLPENRTFVAMTFPELASEGDQKGAAGCELALAEEYEDHIIAPVSRLNAAGFQEIHEVIYPPDVLIKDIWFDELARQLRFSMAAENERAEIELIIPQGLLPNRQAGDLKVTRERIDTEAIAQYINDHATILTIGHAQEVSAVAISGGTR